MYQAYSRAWSIVITQLMFTIIIVCEKDVLKQLQESVISTRIEELQKDEEMQSRSIWLHSVE